MKTLGTTAFAIGMIAFSGSAFAECKINGAFDKNNKGSSVSFFSSNTNAGAGNGGETATRGTVLGREFTLCASGLNVDDSTFNRDAFDPLVVDVKFFGNQILYSETATDPGNSAPN